VIALAIDENFDHHILRALLRRVPTLDARTVFDAGLKGADDPTVLEWAAREGRVLLTHDVRTMTRFAYERIARGEPMPGVIEVRARAPMGEILDDLLLIVECALHDELRDRVVYVPQRRS
jgi:predicted nuclease of predicted toxin-antitoxin system